MKKKSRKKKTSAIETTIISIAIVFCIVLGISKIVLDNVSWLSVFAPVVVAFFITALIAVVKSAVKKI